MDKPYAIQKAINLIWTLIVLNIVVALINKWSGQIHSTEFVFYLVATALYSIIPLKLNTRSNIARLVFTGFVLISFLMLIGGAVETLTRIDLIFAIFTMPLYFFCIYLLFKKESSAWFSGAEHTAGDKNKKEPTLKL